MFVLDKHIGMTKVKYKLR